MHPSYTSRWFYVAHLLAAAVGVAGLFAPPSPSVAAVLGEASAPWAVWAWSAAFTVSGLLGTLARWRGWVLAEAWAIDTMGGVFALWALMVAIASPASGLQAALGFALAAAFMHGSARGRRRRRAVTVDQLVSAQATIATEAAMVGENGPEILDLGLGASVIPLSDGRPDAVADPDLKG